MRIESLGLFNPLCESKLVVTNRESVPQPVDGFNCKPCFTPDTNVSSLCCYDCFMVDWPGFEVCETIIDSGMRTLPLQAGGINEPQTMQVSRPPLVTDEGEYHCNWPPPSLTIGDGRCPITFADSTEEGAARSWMSSVPDGTTICWNVYNDPPTTMKFYRSREYGRGFVVIYGGIGWHSGIFGAGCDFSALYVGQDLFCSGGTLTLENLVINGGSSDCTYCPEIVDNWPMQIELTASECP